MALSEAESQLKATGPLRGPALHLLEQLHQVGRALQHLETSLQSNHAKHVAQLHRSCQPTAARPRARPRPANPALLSGSSLAKALPAAVREAAPVVTLLGSLTADATAATARQQQQQQQQPATEGPAAGLDIPGAVALRLRALLNPHKPGAVAARDAAAARAGGEGGSAGSDGVLCYEVTGGRQRMYRRKPALAADGGSGGGAASAQEPGARAAAAGGPAAGAPAAAADGFDICEERLSHRRRVENVFKDLVADFLLPQGFPDSVAPDSPVLPLSNAALSCLQYFFGGALSVYTTRSLLGALGVANRHTGEAAAAVNWVVKDGAGRMGRFLFARWGRQLDSELKQFRLGGDLLMEAGKLLGQHSFDASRPPSAERAAMELATALAPRLFLPLACTANLAKNLAAVAASATRAPIYRAFARQNNLGDITAKGASGCQPGRRLPACPCCESVANLADVLGTAFGIALTRTALPVVPAFVLLSVGYLVSSRFEVDSVVLPYLNRARLSYAARCFCDTGLVPQPEEANREEPLLPWSDPHGRRVVLGATVAEACGGGPDQLAAALREWSGRRYALTYRPDTRKAYVLLRQGADRPELLQAVLDAHLLLCLLGQQQAAAAGTTAAAAPMQSEAAAAASGAEAGGAAWWGLRSRGAGGSGSGGGSSGVVACMQQEAGRLGPSPAAALAYVAREGPALRKEFVQQAEAGGWRLTATMLSARDTRILVP
eukprot:scaffold4.g4989.t1